MFLSAGLKNQAHGAGKEKSMNVRKPTDYSVLFATLDALVAANLPQMELYCEIGRLVSGRPEKGAAVAAAEHLHSTYPDASGFSPGTCGGCGTFTAPTPRPRRCCLKP